MNFKETIFQEMGINYDSFDDYEILAKTAPQHCFCIDRFPLLIESIKRYEQVELYYPWLKRDKTLLNFFKIEEQKFINVISKLWLYNKVFNRNNLNEISHFKINKNDKNTFLKLKTDLKKSKNNILNIENINYLKFLVKMATRELIYSEFLFCEYKILIIAYGLSFPVYIHDLSQLQIFNKIIMTEGLYLRPYNTISQNSGL